MTEISFWYDFASTYSYVTALRIAPLAEAAGLTIRWRPFLLGPVFMAQGWTDSPFNLYPAKGRYMWRDLERLCVAEGLTLRHPSVFPRNSLLAARVALAAEPEGWCPDFTRAVFTANFAEDRDIADPVVLAEVVARLGRNAEAALARAAEPENKLKLRARTEEAMALGIFGAPTLLVDGEIFWGNDRLEQAIHWAVGRPPA